MDGEKIRIREYQPGDRDELYRICLLTSDNGGDGTASFRDPRLPGDIYAVPYAVLEPSLAFVAEDAEEVGGYAVATLDTREFGRRLERDWLPAARVRHPDQPPDLASQLSVQERTALRNIHVSWKPGEDVPGGYPSHLHINLLPSLQGRGMGRRLISALLTRLREQGSAGVHLGTHLTNVRAAGFYRHLGFTELAATDAHLFAMDLRDHKKRLP
ncbi:MAG: GNAT family N-acetyltransferase [Nocardiopsaceae bacterium]|jgi:ribosomal protein S18 acetylase RimI-like enzyme|nr:GNAT family N-acetyltransferase [Nocardiopsaceae bacterium]